MKNIFNIKSNYNFLESLVHFILEKYGSDLLYLSKITILLPSRRSCRVIKEIFLKQSGKNAIILPNIKAIGDVDYDEIALNFLENSENLTRLIDAPISKIKYRCLLIEEIRKFNVKTHLFGEKINSSQIDLIATNLELFLEEIEREELDLDNLENIDEADLAGHKQKILQFLRHFGSNWRQILAKNHLKSVFSHQKEMINLNTEVLNQLNLGVKKERYPIIAAGSTGSVKATARFLKAISHLENGFIFLYGLNKNIPLEILNLISENHPQFALHKLLKTLEVFPNQVQEIAFEQFKLSDDQVNQLLSYSFLPSQKTDFWTKISDLDVKAVQNLTLVECKNTFDEAMVIALIMLENLKVQGQNIGLVTSDKDLALMVKEILLKFNINIDNSKNNHLVESEIAAYLLAIAVFSGSDFKVSNLLTILKNPITRAGFADDFYESNLKLLEIEILRKNFSLKNFELIEQKISEFNDESLTEWFSKIRKILENFTNFNSDNFLAKILANIDCASNLSHNSIGDIKLDMLAGYKEFADFLEELRQQIPSFKIENEVYPQILRQFLSGYNFEIKENHHPRLHILSPIEARIMNFDVMIVANLNEGEFVSQIQTQNWLSRKMRLNFGLSDLTKKIGVSAFDFCNYLGNKKVFLTRSLSKNNAPTTKLRFLLKLETILKAVNLREKFDDGKYWHFLLQNFYPKSDSHIKEKTLANPPLKNRLKRVSVTDFSKWISDPYYIYAKRILNLKALNKIDEEASFASFGNFIHEVLENFVKDFEQITTVDKLAVLLGDSYGQKYFFKYFLNKENHILWWSRFENIAIWFVKNEIEIRKNLKEILTEVSLKFMINNLEITTKIDRINIDLENNISIIDYKTGSTPAGSNVKKGLEPQLPIEALIFLLNNNFDFKEVKSLQYYSLKAKDKNKIENLGNVFELIQAADSGIKQLIEIFNHSFTPFYACPNPEIYKENEYKHLARIE